MENEDDLIEFQIRLDDRLHDARPSQSNEEEPAGEMDMEGTHDYLLRTPMPTWIKLRD